MNEKNRKLLEKHFQEKLPPLKKCPMCEKTSPHVPVGSKKEGGWNVAGLYGLAEGQQPAGGIQMQNVLLVRCTHCGFLMSFWPETIWP